MPPVAEDLALPAPPSGALNLRTSAPAMGLKHTVAKAPSRRLILLLALPTVALLQAAGPSLSAQAPTLGVASAGLQAVLCYVAVGRAIAPRV
ncbi:MAG TPA: hypothetical protein VGN26_00935 [Armatimonadota bacterium]|jgi:hypothetical protein